MASSDAIKKKKEKIVRGLRLQSSFFVFRKQASGYFILLIFATLSEKIRHIFPERSFMWEPETSLSENRNNPDRIRLLPLLLYFILAVPMYFTIDGAVEVGGFGLMYHYLYGIGIVAVGFFFYLFTGYQKRCLWVLKWAAVLSLSYLVPLAYSCLIWSFRFSPSDYITKGLFYNIYMLIGILVSGMTFYLFGDLAVPVSVAAMATANTMIMIPVAVENPAEFVQELITLIVSFGNETGPMVKSIEIHDLTFAFGVYLLYALVRKDCPMRWYVIGVSLFFSLTGLKRIAFMGIAAGYMVCRLFQKMTERKAKRMAFFLCGMIVLASYVYIIAVHNGLFDILEDTFHIHTLGRNLIYRQLNTLFSFSPFFLGNGIGFSGHAWDGMTGRKVIHDAFHNEYIRMYIEIGFWGYIMWWLTNIFVRLSYGFRKEGKDGGLYLLAMILYLYCTYSSDNTYYYYYTSMALFLLCMCGKEHRLEV